jgi:hypothetical protein
VTSGTFEAVKSAFKKSLSDSLGISDPPKGAWLAVNNALLRRASIAAFADAALPQWFGIDPEAAVRGDDSDPRRFRDQLHAAEGM